MAQKVVANVKNAVLDMAFTYSIKGNILAVTASNLPTAVKLLG